MNDIPDQESGRPSIRSYRDLTVWQDAMDLVVQIYSLTKSLPDDERFGLTSQLRRAAVSIPSNIAEGWGRNRTGEYIQHLRYASGSLREVETQLLIANRVGFLSEDEVSPALKSCDEISRMLRALIRSLEKSDRRT